MEARVVIGQPDLRLVGRVRVSVIFTVIVNLITIGEWVWLGGGRWRGRVMWGWGGMGWLWGVQSDPSQSCSALCSHLPFTSGNMTSGMTVSDMR